MCAAPRPYPPRSARLSSGARTGSRRPPARRTRRFREVLTIHHRAEDSHLWPVLRPKVAGEPERERLLDEMDAEHSVLDPLLASVGAALAGRRRQEVAPLLDQATEKLTAHLDHEEKDTLPLIQEVMTVAEYDAFGQEQRRMLGLRAGSAFLPWVLDGASEETRRTALGALPPPVRLIYRAVWKPRYERGTRRGTGL
ncbi:hemerythrin domain-containing protein [Streptomyces sp. N2-109]|uniref:Hemerythrin domain-containing protein n=1 Tax=Streptomyces gossypii TaxID=2883101 RepID=A0ABT2JUP5_9ACTN|nr:hemerythrin domain-containing protein [Streptomyces gossypii]MCT2591590.1 hemerythrin domain-containing protein [Streptomyces gossypii]